MKIIIIISNKVDRPSHASKPSRLSRLSHKRQTSSSTPPSTHSSSLRSRTRSSSGRQANAWLATSQTGREKDGGNAMEMGEGEEMLETEEQANEYVH